MILLSLLGCPFEEEPVACEYSSSALVATVESTLSGDLPSAAYAVTAEDAQPRVEGLFLDYTLTNLGEADCAVAIYVSSTEPDPEALPVIDAVTNPPPETLPGVGTRIMRANLAPAGTNVAFISGWNQLLAEGSTGFVTLLACEGAQVEAVVSVYAEACATEVDEVAAGVTRLW